MLRGLGAASGSGARRAELAAFGASFDTAGAGIAAFDGPECAGATGSASAFGLVAPLTMASVSDTGVAAELGAADVEGATGAGEAATGAG